VPTTATQYLSQVNQNFPVRGQDNDSQGFRNNWKNLVGAVASVNAQADYLSINALDVTNTTSTFYGNTLANVNLQNESTELWDNGILSGDITIDYSLGSYQKISLDAGFHNITVINWPGAGKSGSLKLSINPTTDTPTSVNFVNTEALGPTKNPYILIGTNNLFELNSEFPLLAAGNNVLVRYLNEFIANDSTGTFALVAKQFVIKNPSGNLSTNHFYSISSSTGASSATIVQSTIRNIPVVANVGLVPNLVTTKIEYGEWSSPTGSNAQTFQVNSVRGILTGATFNLTTTNVILTVTTISNTASTISCSPTFPAGIGTGIVIFKNPSFSDNGESTAFPNLAYISRNAANTATGVIGTFKGAVQASANHLEVTFADYGGGTANTFVASTLAVNTVTDNSMTLANTQFVHQILPGGAIIMWYGTVATIPTGWSLCDGSNNTPDLRNRFIVGAGSDYRFGGASKDAATTQVLGTTSTIGGSAASVLPSHSHTGNFNGTSEPHTHTINDPGHDHTGGVYKNLLRQPYVGSLTGVDTSGSGSEQAVGVNDGGPMETKTTGISISSTSTKLSGAIAIESTGTVDTTHANIPPFFALCYIMKTTGFFLDNGGSNSGGGNSLGTPIIATPNIPSGTANILYSNITLSASGGTGTYTYTRSSGSLPTGLSLSSGGLISGTPTAAGTYTFSVTATDNAQQTSVPISISITIAAAVQTGSPVIATPNIPSGTANILYSNITLSASGGTSPYTYARSSGSLPTGLSLSSGGLISGTPTAAGTYTFGVTATDNAQQTSVPISISITIAAAVQTGSPVIAQPTVTLGAVNTVYPNITLSTSGGTAPYTYAASGNLPTGLSLNTSTGVISGTPTVAGTYPFSVTATDRSSPPKTSVPVSISIGITPVMINSPLTISPATSSGTGYITTGSFTVTSTSSTSQVVTVQNTRSYMGATVTIGTPTFTLAPNGSQVVTFSCAYNQFTSGDFTFGFGAQAAGANGTYPTHTHTQTHAAITPVVIAQPSVSRGTINTIYPTITLSASGGTGPYTYAASGSLPTGMLLSSGGSIIGIPTVAGTSTFSVTATDSAQQTSAAISISITIAALIPVVIATPSLPNGKVGTVYSPITLSASGGTGPYTWTQTFVGLGFPPGLSLNGSTGVISGTPTVAGLAFTSITVTDSAVGQNQQTAIITLQFNIDTATPPVTIAQPTAPTGRVGVAYATPALSTTGGVAPYTYSLDDRLVQQSLPPGLSLNSSTGVISGTPTKADYYYVEIKATDSGSPISPIKSSVSIGIYITITA